MTEEEFLKEAEETSIVSALDKVMAIENDAEFEETVTRLMKVMTPNGSVADFIVFQYPAEKEQPFYHRYIRIRFSDGGRGWNTHKTVM